MGKKEANIKVIIVEPQKPARVEMIKNDLETLQTLVGGYIEYIKEDGFDIIINEEGKLFELEPNFAIYGGQDYIVGTAVFAGVDYKKGESKSLTDKQIETILFAFGGREHLSW
jgi:hypothetical protein